VAVALLMGRAETGFAKEQPGGNAYRERENVRAHMRQLVGVGYDLSAGELAQLAEPFGIDGLDEPAPRRPWGVAGTFADDGDGGGAGDGG
jgi:hypothetical protein